MMFRKNAITNPPENCEPEKAVTAKNRTRTFIMIGLALGMLLASLDQTIVGTSLPKIGSELGGMELFAWLFTAYMLAETITIPIAGKMSDRVGRKPVFMVGMGLFMGGSILAGMSNSMEMLIFCRFLQGLGGGAMMPVAMATVADLYAPQERGKIQGMMGAIFGIASVIGPFLGGYIVDNLDWRWVFYVNVPIGVIAIIVTSMKFPSKANAEVKAMDYKGMVTLIGALVPFLLILTWGGSTYAWDSMEILGLALLAVLSFLAFMVVEPKAADPIIPFALFKEPIFTLGTSGLFIMSLGLFGVISFLPLFLQAVIGMSATNSGATLIPLMLGMMATMLTSGFLLKKTGYKPWLIIGPPVAAFGLFMLSTLHVGSSQTDAIIYLIIVGAGLGAVMSNYIVAAQNVACKKDMGALTSTMSLFRGIGGTIGVTIFGTLLNREFATQLGQNLSPEAMAVLPFTDPSRLGGMLLVPEAAAQFPTAIIEAIRVSLGNSIDYIFFIAAILVAIAVVFSVFIRKVPLKSVEEYHEAVPAKENETVE
jgi:EmrB/QacA subfamily drug resistance transporter